MTNKRAKGRKYGNKRKSRNTDMGIRPEDGGVMRGTNDEIKMRLTCDLRSNGYTWVVVYDEPQARDGFDWEGFRTHDAAEAGTKLPVMQSRNPRLWRWVFGHGWQAVPESESELIMTQLVIEYPAVGATYRHDEYGVYEYGTYPESSVLAGQERRSCLGTFPTLAEARAEFPAAEYTDGSGYREIHIPEAPPDWFDPEAAGERWNDDY